MVDCLSYVGTMTERFGDRDLHHPERSRVLTIECEVLLSILDDLGKARPLTDAETDIVEEIVSREGNAFRWDDQLDASLLEAMQATGGIARFARRHGITGSAAYNRIYRLRQREKRRR